MSVPIPPLVVILSALEKEKGAPLTEDEVTRARDKAVCMAMPLSAAIRFTEARGYDDINPENVWEEWRSFREARSENE